MIAPDTQLIADHLYVDAAALALVRTPELFDVIVTAPHSSVAVATPAAGIVAGLHPRSPPAGQNVNCGGTLSSVQVNTCWQVD